jgi:protein SCO1
MQLKKSPHVWKLAVFGVLLSACASNLGTPELQGFELDEPQPKPSFVLTDTSGAAYDFRSETEGKVTLLYFGYLNCPDICPVHLAQIAEVFSQYPEVAREAEMVFVSVDPNRDSPQEIRAFLDNFDSRFVGLTGTPDDLAAAQEAAGVPVATVTGDGDDYLVDHAGWVVAYAPDGISRSTYPFGTRQAEWSNDLQVLMRIPAGG